MRVRRLALAGGVVLAPALVAFAGNDLLRALESDAPSRSVGSPAAGRLIRGKRLPSRGPGFRTYSRLGSLLGRTAVDSRVRATVLDAYARVHRDLRAVTFVYGETGWPHGGRFRPHRTHQNGMSVDFMVPVRHGARPAVLPTSPWTEYGYGVRFDAHGRAGAGRRALAIDFEAMARHLAALQAAAAAHGLAIEQVIFAPDLQPALLLSPTGRRLRGTLPLSPRPAWIRHDGHYHVDFRPVSSERRRNT